MLTELNIREFGLMEDVQLKFASGMTVFTGETGAGKSILVGALSAIFGARTRADWVRHGAKQAELTAVVESHHPHVIQWLDEQGLEAEEVLILRRVISQDGRSRAWLNGSPVALKTLQYIGNMCLDIHAQHEHQSLMKASTQRQWLDSRLPQQTLQSVAEAYQQWQHTRQALLEFQQHQHDNKTQADWMRAEYERLQSIQLHEGLHDALQQQVETGQHTAHIQQAATQAATLLEEGESNVRDLLAQSSHAISAYSSYHEGLREAEQLLEQMDALLGEITPHIQDAQDITLDAEALQEAEQQWNILRESMSRHQCDEAGLLALMHTWQQRLDALDTAEWDETRLKQAHQAAEEAYRHAAAALHEARLEAAQSLTQTLRPYLDRLGMQGMRLDIQLHEQHDDAAQWSPHGWDVLEFLVSSNPGEPFRKLADVASGGELSRFALALKAAGSYAHAPDIAVFDEVDVGVGGETAWCVGEMLAAMSQDKQVFVVSHLPQVAACAHHQISIIKAERQGRTITDLVAMSADERPAELARMLGGVHEESLEHARHMLQHAHNAS